MSRSTHAGYLDSAFTGGIDFDPSLNPFEGINVIDFAETQSNTLSAGGGIYEPIKDIAHLFATQNAGNHMIGPSAVQISSKPGYDVHQILPLPPLSSTKEASSSLGHEPTTLPGHEAHETNIGGRYVANPVQNGKPCSSISGVLKQAPGSKPSIATTGPSNTTSGSKIQFPSSKSTGKKSPATRTAMKLPKPTKCPVEIHTIPDSPPTPTPLHPRPSLPPIPFLPPVSQLIDPSLVNRVPQSCPISSAATTNRRVSPFQENLPQKTSVPAVLPRKRSASPLIRPAIHIYRKRTKKSHEDEGE